MRVACLVIALIAIPAAAQQPKSQLPVPALITDAAGLEKISLEEYIAAIGRLTALVDADDRPAAAEAAAELEAQLVVLPEGEMATDSATLAAVREWGAGAEEASPRTRLHSLSASLRRTGVAGEASDRALLEQLRRNQASEGFEEGGDVRPGSLALGPLETVLTWMNDRLVEFWKWLRKIFRFKKPHVEEESALSLVLVMVALVVGIIVAALVLLVMRSRRGRVAARVVAAPIAPESVRDDDPLSRTAAEWQRHAAELEAAGRTREAVRAHYHAVLVTHFGAGLLHPRKGRTNWEHVRLLSPSVRWRSDLADLTREFERVWYGLGATDTDTIRRFASVSRDLTDRALATRGPAPIAVT